MERLTYATKGRKHKYQTKKFGVEEKFRCFDKLGKLEDIEELLGIDLTSIITLDIDDRFVISVTDSEHKKAIVINVDKNQITEEWK